MLKHETKNQPILQEIERMAADTFQTKEEAARWLHTAHPMFEGTTPFMLAQTLAGAERVRQILVAIKYGSAL